MAGVSKGGRASLGTRSCLQGLVCYTFCGSSEHPAHGSEPAIAFGACRFFDCAAGLLLSESNPLRWGSIRLRKTEGACGGAAQGPFGGAGQAGFAGRMAENTGACEKQSPPGRQRLRALGRKACAAGPQEVYKNSRLSSLVSRFSLFPLHCDLRFFIFRFLTHGCFSHFFVFGSQPI